MVARVPVEVEIVQNAPPVIELDFPEQNNGEHDSLSIDSVSMEGLEDIDDNMMESVVGPSAMLQVRNLNNVKANDHSARNDYQ